MRVQSYIARARASWQRWLFAKGQQDRQRRLRAAVPALAALDAQQAEKRRRHASGVRKIDKQKQSVMTTRLRAELGMG